MFNANEYISSLTKLLKEAYNERLIYVGLQVSFLINDATEQSDIVIMFVVM